MTSTYTAANCGVSYRVLSDEELTALWYAGLIALNRASPNVWIPPYAIVRRGQTEMEF